jgi:hypothetical protein
MAYFQLLTLFWLIICSNVTSAQLSCPASNGQKYVDPASQNTYVIECGYDRPGADCPNGLGWVNSLEACITLCSNTPTCVDVAYSPGTPGPCYLKSALNFPAAKNNFMAAHLLSAEGTGCPNPSPVCVDVPDEGTCYYTECDANRGGQILSQVTTSTFQNCLDECEANSIAGCTYVGFNPGVGTILPGGTCTLYSSYNDATLISQPGTWGAIRESICPNRNQGQIRAGGDSQKNYFLECGTDRPGGDIAPPLQTAGVYDCMIACSQHPGCVAVSWHFGFPLGFCYLKGTVTPPTPNQYVNGGYWIPDCYATTTVTTTTYTVYSLSTPISLQLC